MAVITLEEAKAYLRVDSEDENTLISAMIDAAERHVELFTGRVLLTATFELVYDEVSSSIEIPKSPLQEVTKIEVISEAGVKTEVDSSTYDVDTSGTLGRVQLKTGCVWPSHRGFASFIVTVKAGYGDTAAAVPPALKQAALAALAVIFASRGEADRERINSAVAALCGPYKVWRL
jgi:uncharacterized phiE125 gp8 family phage protein